MGVNASDREKNCVHLNSTNISSILFGHFAFVVLPLLSLLLYLYVGAFSSAALRY